MPRGIGGRVWSSRRRGLRAGTFLYQAVAVAALIVLLAALFVTVSDRLRAENVASGFAFLSREAGFLISQSFISYKPTDSYAHALLVGFVNTVVVSALGMLFSTVIGVVIAIVRLSNNILLSFLARFYIELVRNVPLLLYLFLIYAIIIGILPPAREAWQIAPHVFLSNRGLVIPKLLWTAPDIWLVSGLAIGVLLTAIVLSRKRYMQTARKHARPVWFLLWLTSAVIVILFLYSYVLLDFPVRERFRINGGAQLTPEFVALLIGLSVSTSAGIAEIVRGGLSSVDLGQREAAESLGLRRIQVLWLVLAPQAIRAIIPPVTSSYLTLFKNSSLAIAIGYPDLVMVSNMAVTQTGQAIEILGIMTLIYLAMSVLMAIIINAYQRRSALRG